MLGKRKREVAVATRQRLRSLDDEQAVASPVAVDREIFRKYFESTFEPLPETEITINPPQEKEEDDEDKGEDDDAHGDSEEEPEWDGLSDPELTTLQLRLCNFTPRVAWQKKPEHVGNSSSHSCSRPPKEIDRAGRQGPVQEADEGEDAAAEALNLKHDLDLQRLLKESHLLEQATKASSTPGTHRHKVVDMRMQALGSKSSMFHQEKMPLAHRKGILAKAAGREASRRKEARENGIILEKASGKKTSKDARRERAVDVPTVGRFRGGTLTLSKKDVFDIQGPGLSTSRGKTRRRR
ncbi:hypothetical protein AYL99_08764 [Fonsecaea erecta]|uniref:Protein FAF1 n=1 Tax=Fonsecaea erecta TaxID=1367422 RepID=A0A178ZAH4_9EURO|nr:hypothetical protein AYL99_08764 [Fonsecaea erecta]OAP56652.1 hypothetical protein AYL99_08764 [Fonsecaea erecta]